MNASMTPRSKVQKLKTARDLLIARGKLLTPYSDDWYMTRKQLQEVTEEGEATAEEVRVHTLKASFEKAYPLTAKRTEDWRCPISKEWFREYLDDPSSWLPCCQQRICGSSRTKLEDFKKCPLCGSQKYFPLKELDEAQSLQHVQEPWAYLRMALLLEQKNGRHEKSADYLKLAADAGHPIAICHLGSCHYTSSNPHIPQSNEKARELFLKSAQQGYSEAQYNLGLFCLEEEADDEEIMVKSKPQNGALVAQIKRRRIRLQQEGLRWISLAAVGGSVAAQGMLATMYCNSFGKQAPVKKNLFLAKYWAQKGTAKNDGTCQLVLAQVLMILASQTFDGSYTKVGYNPIPRVLFLLRKTAADPTTTIQTETNREKALKTLQNIEAQISLKCANCGIQNVPLQQCQRCRAVYYCGKKCSTEHWKKGHKVDCLKKEEAGELESYLRTISLHQSPAATSLFSIAEDLAATKISSPATTAMAHSARPIQSLSSPIGFSNPLN